MCSLPGYLRARLTWGAIDARGLKGLTSRRPRLSGESRPRMNGLDLSDAHQRWSITPEVSVLLAVRQSAWVDCQDKRFKALDIDGDSHVDRYADDFMWLVDANAALAVYNVNEPRYPLEVSSQSKRMKLFSSDVGLLTYQCGMDVVRDISLDRTDINFGAIDENAIAQELTAHGFKPRYYKNRSRTGASASPISWCNGLMTACCPSR